MHVDDEIGVALDLATHSTGVFEAVGDELYLGRLFKIVSHDDKDWYKMARKVTTYLSLRHPHYVCIEDIHYDKNPGTFKKLAFMSATIRAWCYDNNVPCYVASTAEIDSRCGIPTGIKRDRRKKHLRDFAKLVYGEAPQDVADALAVMWWGKGIRRLDVLAQETENDA